MKSNLSLGTKLDDEEKRNDTIILLHMSRFTFFFYSFFLYKSEHLDERFDHTMLGIIITYDVTHHIIHQITVYTVKFN